MTDAEPGPSRIHEDHAFFRAAVSHTAAETQFPPALIEKDYFCSLALWVLASESTGCVFKGGTSLSKVHVGAYRISEDLDFSVPIAENASRRERSASVEGLRRALERIEQLALLRLSRPLRGSNESRQYSAHLAYSSRLEEAEREIKAEVGAREPLQTAPFVGDVLTLLRDPVTGGHAFPKFRVACLSQEETLAEKFRAALTRRVPAIRDFFDIRFAMRNLLFQPLEPAFLELVRRKIAIAETGPVDASSERLAELRRQLESELRPVLRPGDYGVFDLDSTFAVARDVANALG